MRLNHLANGQVCPSCRDRLLEALPAPFPFVAGDREDEPYDAPEAVEEPSRELAHLPRRPHPSLDNEPA